MSRIVELFIDSTSHLWQIERVNNIDALKVIEEHAKLGIPMSADVTQRAAFAMAPLRAALEFLSEICPLPFTLEQDNSRGVCVKDNRGAIIFNEMFGDFPDESNANQREQWIRQARALAHFLIAL